MRSAVTVSSAMALRSVLRALAEARETLAQARVSVTRRLTPAMHASAGKRRAIPVLSAAVVIALEVNAPSRRANRTSTSNGGMRE